MRLISDEMAWQTIMHQARFGHDLNDFISYRYMNILKPFGSYILCKKHQAEI